ncbi:MAG: VIT domain-containing protein [Kofleriaceae bacterium]
MRLILWVSILGFGCKANARLDYLSPPPASDGRTGLGGLGLSQALQREYHDQLDRTPPPLSLVPSDGSELELKALEAKVKIDGPLAKTELHFTFHNSEKRQREGRFAITLPAGVAVGKFAMMVAGTWREARIVTRAQGREVYERFLHRRTDPALLEQDLGNQFSTRIYPIEALEDKELVVGYEHVVSETQPYTLALRGLPKIPKLTIEIDQDTVVTKTERVNVAPEDVVAAISPNNSAVVDDDTFVARLALPALLDRPAVLDRVMILVDTSASRATVMGRQADVVRRLVAAMPESALVSIAAFDQTVTELYRGPAREAGLGVDRVLEHGALGASNLGAALARAAVSGMTRVIIVGDGAATAGETDARKLAASLAGIQRVDAVQVGQSLDRDTLHALVRAGEVAGAILDSRDVARVAHQLGTAVGDELAITVAGATQTWPATTAGVTPGDPVFVSGRFTGKPPAVLAVTVGDHVVRIPTQIGDHAMIDRTVARAEVAQLSSDARAATDADARKELRLRVARLAMANNLVSSETSLLVLESDADEARMLGPKGDASYQGIIPTGRTFQSVLGAAAGSQSDNLGVSFSGSTSLENQYYVDGINTTGLTYGWSWESQRPYRQFRGPNGLRMSAFAFDGPERSPAPQRVPGKDVSGPSKYTAHDPVAPYTGQLRDVMSALAQAQRDRGLELAAHWQLQNPGEVAAIVALGEALEARGATVLAARAYGSLIDLYPNRVELVRAAGERLDRLGDGARELAIDAYRRAIRERPDHAQTYRLLAYALLRAGQAEAALQAILDGSKKVVDSRVGQVLAQDAKLVAAALVARDPARRDEIEKRIEVPIATKRSLSVVLIWETDANDLDLHIRDGNGKHAYHGKPALASGGSLLADQRDGYGPELFQIDEPKAFPYRISAHYFNRGPMGLALGTVQIIRHDGAGNIAIEDRPFTLQNDQGMIELGTISAAR